MRGRTSASLLDRVLATRPRAEPQPRADTLALAGRPLPPSLRAVLAHDATWLPALVDASVEDVALAAALFHGSSDTSIVVASGGNVDPAMFCRALEFVD